MSFACIRYSVRMSIENCIAVKFVSHTFENEGALVYNYCTHIIVCLMWMT